MKKFSFLIFFILIIILIIIAAEYTAKKVVNNQLMKYQSVVTDEQIKLINKYYKKIHHIRDPNSRWVDTFNRSNFFMENFPKKWILKKTLLPTDIIFTEYNLDQKNLSDDLILFQGDSNIEQMFYNHSRIIVEKYLLENNKRGINAGNSSYSISPMTVQLKILREDFNIRPKQIVAFFDLTDLGDELCRYKNKLVFDEDKKLSYIKPENFYSEEIFNLEFYLKKYKYLSNKDLFALQKMFIYSFYKINKILFSKKKYCDYNKILSYLTNKISTKEEEYIINLVKLYVNEVFSDSKTEKLLIAFHPKRFHYYNKSEYVFTWNEIFNKINFGKELNQKIKILNFYENFPEFYTSKGLKIADIWRKGDFVDLIDQSKDKEKINKICTECEGENSNRLVDDLHLSDQCLSSECKIAHPIMTSHILENL